MTKTPDSIESLREEILDVLRRHGLELQEIKQSLSVRSKQLLTVEDTAKYLSVAPKSIRNGLGPRAKRRFAVKPLRIGKRVLFRRSDLDRYIESL